MHDDKALTAYCGLYCRDCIPSHARLFELLEELRVLAEELCLDEYTRLIAHRDEAYEEYAAFERMLDRLAGLRCMSPCREGGGRPACTVRECALAKGFEGCWECADRSGCALLEPLRRSHGETIAANLDAIEECGPDGWAGRRGKHYPWS